MGQQLVVRPHRKRRKVPVGFLAGTPAGAAAGGGNAVGPSLLMYEPEGHRNTLISGSIAASLHLGLLGVVILTALLAPRELIEKVIPVELVRELQPIELPGSNQEPAPAGPKAVGMTRPSAAALAAAQAMTPEQAEALRQAALEAARKALQEMQLEAQQQTALPTPIERRQVEAQSLAARAAAVAKPHEAVKLEELQAIQLDPADLAALELDLAGPRKIDTSSLTELSAPEAFAVLSQLGEIDYSGSVTATNITPGVTIGRGYGDADPGVDTAVSSLYAGSGGEGSGVGGGGSGGTGTAVGVVRCLESAHVARYLDMLEERTKKRWRVPEDVPANTKVILSFDLDAAGMATNVEAEEAENQVLGESAVRALLAAMPFPSMDDNNRCLTDKRLTATFTVPTR